jgi:primosomal replication protein N
MIYIYSVSLGHRSVRRVQGQPCLCSTLFQLRSSGATYNKLTLEFSKGSAIESARATPCYSEGWQSDVAGVHSLF